MGGVNQNDNAAAALFMSQLVGLSAKRGIGVMVAHHAAKGRDPTSAESAMGAASYVNLSRIALAIEPLASHDAGKLGLPPWEARDVFRVVGTKQNFSPPTEKDRWYRLVSIEMNNAEPPTYPNGDKVGVVEIFQPTASTAAFADAMIRDALSVIDNAATPLSPSKRATGRYAVPLIAQAIAPHRGGHASDTEAEAVLDHLMREGLVNVQQVKLTRPGGRHDVRNGLVLSTAGKQQVQRGKTPISPGPPAKPSAPLPATPASPASPAKPMRDEWGDAGRGPLGAPATPKGGVGGNAGGIVAGACPSECTSDTADKGSNLTPRVHRAPTQLPPVADDMPGEPTVLPTETPAVPSRSSAREVQMPSCSAAAVPVADDLDIPPFLRRAVPADKKAKHHQAIQLTQRSVF
jgi:hypothetical protein